MAPAEYDLFPKMAQFFDRHLMFPMLDAAEEEHWYPEEQIRAARLQLLEKTSSVEYQMELLKEAGQPIPAELEARSKTVVEDLKAKQEELQPLLDVLEGGRTISAEAMIQEPYNFSVGIFEKLYEYALLVFKGTDYPLTHALLGHYLGLLQSGSEPADPKRVKSVLWGMLACCILNANWALALDTAGKLADAMNKDECSSKETLVQRSWFVHWLLFILFKQEDADGVRLPAPKKALDLFLSEVNYQTMLFACPHLLRYVAALLILNRNLVPILKDITWLLQAGAHQTQDDPMVRFVLTLYGELDFEQANVELLQCQKLVETDYFLRGYWDQLQENARLHIFEVYCRVHQKIDISMIAEKLNMSADEAEIWIVRLIQNAKLPDARIDSEKNRVIMGHQKEDIYKSVIEKTKNIPFRSMLLMSTLQKVNTKTVAA